MHVAEGPRQEHGVSHTVRRRKLLAQKVRVRTRWPTVRRATVEPAPVYRIPVEVAPLALIAVTPRHRHVPLDLLCASRRGMHVAVDDTHLECSFSLCKWPSMRDGWPLPIPSGESR